MKPVIQFYSKKRAKQKIAFDSLKYGEYTPFGIDLALEYHEYGNVLAHLYREGEKVDRSIRETFKFLTRCFAQQGKPSIGIIARKSFCDNDDLILIGEALADEVYVNGTQTISLYPKCVREEINRFTKQIPHGLPKELEDPNLYKPVPIVQLNVEHPEITKREWHNLIGFDGLSVEGEEQIYPTDIDLFLNYGNKAVVIGELKKAGTDNKSGQNLLIGRFTEWLWNAGIPAIGVFAEHNVEDPKESVDFGECRVRYFYYNGKQLEPWEKRDPTKDEFIPFSGEPYQNVKALVDEFLSHVNNHYKRKVENI